MGNLYSDSTSESEEILNEQLRDNKAELERKKQSLYETRLDIIKSQGAQSWSPNYAPRAGSGAGDSEAAQRANGTYNPFGKYGAPGKGG
jgi:hypothetical protein